MSHIKARFSLLCASLILAALVFPKTQAQGATLPAAAAFPSSAADTSQPGFVFDISEVANSQPNTLAFTEAQLAGLEGDNLADPSLVGVASGPAQPPSPSTAPISFIIPGVINLSKTDGTTFGHFQPDGQMPGLPGTGGSTDNAAAEMLTYLMLPAGTITMGVNSDDGFRLTIGGANPRDQFAMNVGQFEGGRGSGDTIFQFVTPQAGLYAARLLWENGGGDANVEWYTILDGMGGTNYALVNDTANGGVPAYRAVTTVRAYASKVDPAPSAIGVVPNEGVHVALVDGASPIAQAGLVLMLDGAPVTPTINKSGNVTSVDYSPATPWASQSQHTASLVFMDGSAAVTNTWSFSVQTYSSIDPAWRVTNYDTSKPGFIWNIFANPDSANTKDSNERAESDLILQAVDANGLALPNLADPAAPGAATGPGVATGGANGPVHFEIATTINLDTATNNMPGAPSTDGSTDGQAAEVLTYLNLPAGVLSMEIDSDNGFRLYAGANPADIFERVVIAERNDAHNAAGPMRFSFFVAQAGVYPFRLAWENGTGGSHLIWRTLDSSGNTILVNDTAHGGVAAYRALASGATVAPQVKGTVPLPAIHQLEVNNTTLTVVIADGTNPVDDSSVTLTVDGKTITPVKNRQGNFLIVSDGGTAFPGLQLPSDVHSATLSFKDSTGTARTQQWSFNNIQILVLPASPVKQENFDSYPEATSTANTVPPGWKAWNYTAVNTPGWDLSDKSSDSYKDWILISSDTTTSIEGSALNNDPTQTINGQPVANFASGTLLWATSDGRSDIQAQFCTSAPFDLSSVANPVLIYSSLMRMSAEANEQADGIDYSIDGGKTWQAGIVYVTIAHSRDDNIYLLPDGSIDVLRTLNAPFSVLDWVDPSTGNPGGGSPASGMAEPVTQDLAPLLAPRSDNTVTSTKVDGFRLPMAAKQKSVMLRFYQLGNCSWWWGVDNLAFYDVAPPVAPPANPPHIETVLASAGKITITWTNGGTLESSPALNNPTWTSTGNSSGSFSESIGSSGNKFYRVKQ